MMFKNFLGHVFVFSLILGCSEETSEEQLILKGKIKGKVYLASEFGILEKDQSGATLTLEGLQEPISVVTNSEGRFTFENVPTGNYNLTIEKNGFSTFKRKGFTVMGGNEPLYTSFSLSRSSTITIDDLSLSVSNQSIGFTFILNHQNLSSFPAIRIVCFFSNEPDVSSAKHVSSVSFFYIGVPSGSSLPLSFSVYADPAIFPAGSTFYGVIHGYSGGVYFNPETNRYEYMGLGAPSGIASITIP